MPCRRASDGDPEGNNLQRYVILPDDQTRARQVVPLPAQEPLGSTDPLLLYQWRAPAFIDYEKGRPWEAISTRHPRAGSRLA